MLIVVRTIHAGRVVSGDLCPEGVTCDYKGGYMKWTGQFLIGWLVWTFAIYVFFICKTMKTEIYKTGVITKPSRPDFAAKYKRMDKKPLGAGGCAYAWKV